MIIIGADYHPGFQQIASLDTDSGEFQEQLLAHREDAEKVRWVLTGHYQRLPKPSQ
jgi:hypothetical protein